jgi:hypothetical protein
MSAVPRPKTFPSRTVRQNGSLDQIRLSTGTTSAWPESNTPGWSLGPASAHRFAFRPVVTSCGWSPRSRRKPRGEVHEIKI